MEEQVGKKPWRLEANNPLTSTDWRPLWDFDEDELNVNQDLRDELNRINAPVELRIVRNPHKTSE